MGEGLLSYSQRSGVNSRLMKTINGENRKNPGCEPVHQQVFKEFRENSGMGKRNIRENRKNPDCGPVHQQVFKDFVKIPGWGRGIFGKTGKILAVDLFISRFSKILWEFQAREEEYLGKIRAAYRYFNSLHRWNIFPAMESLVSDIPAGSRESFRTFFTVHRHLEGFANSVYIGMGHNGRNERDLYRIFIISFHIPWTI